MTERQIDYTKRDRTEYNAMQREFQNSVKPAWLKANADNAQITDAGVDNAGVARMQNGLVPKNYQVHHIIPLDDGGTNDPSNLILMRQDSEHMLLTNSQMAQTRTMGIGETRPVTLITPPDGAVIWPSGSATSARPGG